MSSFLRKLYEHAHASGLAVVINYKGGDSYRFSIGKLDSNFEYDYDHELKEKEISRMERQRFASCLEIGHCSLPYTKVIKKHENQAKKFCFSLLKDYITKPQQKEYQDFETIFKYWVREINWIECFEYNKATPKDYFEIMPYVLEIAQKYKKTSQDKYVDMHWDTDSWKNKNMREDMARFLSLSVVAHAQVLYSLYLQPMSLVNEEYQTYRNIYEALEVNSSNKVRQIKAQLCDLSLSFKRYVEQKENQNFDFIYEEKTVIETKIDYQKFLIAWGNTKLEIAQLSPFYHAYFSNIAKNNLFQKLGLLNCQNGFNSWQTNPEKNTATAAYVRWELSSNSAITPKDMVRGFLDYLKIFPLNATLKQLEPNIETQAKICIDKWLLNFNTQTLEPHKHTNNFKI